MEPHAIEAEQAVLGSCLIDRDAILHVAPYLEPSAFYRAPHGLIYAAILALYQQRVPADLVAVVDELASHRNLDAAGGEGYLAELIAATPTSVHVEYYRDIVIEHAKRRQLIAAAQDIAGAGYDTGIDVPTAAANAEAALARAIRGMETREVDDLDDVVAHYLAHMDDGPGRLTGFGYRGLDELIGGLEDSDLAIVAGRPAMGKTAFALGTARYVATKLNRRVAYVSLEMNAQKILHRFLAMETGIDSRKIGFRGLSLNDQERWMVEEASGYVRTWPIQIDATGNGRVESMLTRVRALHARGSLDLLIVDGLWLLEWAEARGNRVQEVGKISRMLKLFAMELGIPVIALHQLSRASLSRKDPTPILSDLRESGDVEQDADLVVFIHRPGLLDFQTDREITHLIVAKNRMGQIGRVTMRYDERATRFYEGRYHWEEAAD